MGVRPTRSLRVPRSGFPAMGYGWYGLRSGEAGRLNRIMLVGHIAFGIGIGLWARGRSPRSLRRLT